MTDNPIIASEIELPALKQIESILEDGHYVPRLVGPDGEEIELPQTLVVLLRHIVHYLGHERAVTTVSFNKYLTIYEAADILNISDSYLIKLLEEGTIPSTYIETLRRINFTDLMDYKRQRDEERQEGLAEITRLSEEMGLYD